MSTNRTKTKPTVISQEDFEAELKSEPKVFDVTTLGISPRGDGGYNLVSITLASKTLDVGEVTVVDSAESKFEAIEKFKINAIRLKVI